MYTERLDTYLISANGSSPRLQIVLNMFITIHDAFVYSLFRA